MYIYSCVYIVYNMCTLKSSFLVACHFPFCSTNTKCSLFSSRLEARGNFSQSYSGSASVEPLVRWFEYGIIIFDICHIIYKSIYIYVLYHNGIMMDYDHLHFFRGCINNPHFHHGIIGASRMTIPVPKSVEAQPQVHRSQTIQLCGNLKLCPCNVVPPVGIAKLGFT